MARTSRNQKLWQRMGPVKSRDRSEQEEAEQQHQPALAHPASETLTKLSARPCSESQKTGRPRARPGAKRHRKRKKKKKKELPVQFSKKWKWKKGRDKGKGKGKGKDPGYEAGKAKSKGKGKNKGNGKGKHNKYMPPWKPSYAPTKGQKGTKGKGKGKGQGQGTL